MKIISFVLLMLLLAFSAHAKRFTSQYCEFELPPGWSCALEGTEWVCQSTNKARQKEAIIILAAKIRGTKDSLEDYLVYLKKTKTFSLPGGKVQVSEPKYSKSNEISKHKWVDSLHLASEVPGFYTRYLATVKEDLGIAVSFSVSKDHYSSYQPVFDKMVGTLKVFRKKGAAGRFALKNKDENLLGGTTFIPDVNQKFDIGYQKRKKGSSAGDTTSYLIIIIIVAAVIFFIIKLKKKKKKKK